ncbi:hypothetical protein DKX38_016451 [Salix brachista]|uniref:Uncharacterized protein n=1 Tax=Salix brachista TaxID=2182728 RepID=A0A5N5L8Q0_9ROSI|nr:hypothetical protein DKX38_016451 [Salix brachista]
MATGQVLFHRFYGKKSFAHFNVKKFAELKIELSKTVRNILKEMGFVCHAEHPRKFISNYPATLGTPQQLRQEAWNLANDSCSDCISFLRPAIAVHKIAKFQAPFPENQPWWKALDAEKSGIDEVCKVLAHLYSPPQAQYISVCKDGKFSSSNMSSDSQLQPVLKLDGAWWIA